MRLWMLTSLAIYEKAVVSKSPQQQAIPAMMEPLTTLQKSTG